MGDYLTPQEQSTAIQLVYLRQLYPDYYRAFADAHRGMGSALGEMWAESDALYNADGLGRWKRFKKLLRVIRKINPVYIASRALPKPIRNKLVEFEHKHRAEIKKLGAAAAIIGGGFLFAPSILAAGSSLAHAGAAGLAKLGVLSKGAILSALAKLRGSVPPQVEQEITAQLDKLPDGAQIADRAGQEIVDKVSSLGADKVREIVNRYTDGGARPFTGPDDPRLSAAVMDLTRADPSARPSGQADTQGVNAAVTSSVLQDAQSLRAPGFNPLVLLPVGLFLLS